MSRRSMNTRRLALLAALAALSVILARILGFQPLPYLRLSFEDLPIILAGLLFGPAAGALTGVAADLAGGLLSPYGINPVFTVGPMAMGLSAGLLRGLVIRRADYPRLLAAILPGAVLGRAIWNGCWLYALGFAGADAALALLLAQRLLQYAVVSCLNAALILALFRARVLEHLRLWPSAGTEGKP